MTREAYQKYDSSIKLFFCLFFFILIQISASCYSKERVTVGIDVLFDDGYDGIYLKGKKIGLITNQTAINRDFKSTFKILNNPQKNFKLVALFAPEHGLNGLAYAYEQVLDETIDNIPLYSLHGETRRPTKEMLKNLDLLIYDIQDIGSRSYTYISTLFYCMEEASKRGLKVMVLDRPNPINGLIVDGPLLDEKWRSFAGYINVPYCHGMTIGELAKFFNEEYKIGCDLIVIPMKGWKRWMSFKDTGLTWVPTSPQIPEEDTPFYYPTTGLLGEISLVNMGVGYTLPFKIIGAPWIEAEKLSQNLNKLSLPGVMFLPFYFRPFFGKFKGENCQGIRIAITDTSQFKPMTTQFCMMGVLKNLYPTQFIQGLNDSKLRKEMFIKVTGKEEIYKLFASDGYIIWKLREICQEDRELFMPIRKKYLLPDYQ